VKPDNEFRYILAAIMLAVSGVAALHRVKARTGEALDRKQEGLFSLVVLRLAGLANLVCLVTYLLNPATLRFGTVPLPAWLRWMGAGLGWVAAGLLFWTLHSLGRNLTDTVVTRQRHTLVVTGPYRWVRHPFYACAALIMLSTALIAANAVFLVTGSVVLLLLVLRTPIEESNLLKRFGEDYRRYMDRTGRFFPRF
jgi:protein-S-isoprenylcysteine O-methyltransferase Ste14